MANNFVWVNATTLNGTLWDNGTLSSVTPITQIGTLTISGGYNSKYLNAQLNNTGTIVDTHFNYLLYFQNGAILNNSGIYELQQGLIDNFSSSSVGTFNNSGTFKKTTANTATIGVAFNNTGTVNVESGTLNLYGGGVSNGGTFNLTSGQNLEISNSVYTFSNGAKINGSGNLLVSGGTLQADGNWTLPTISTWYGGTFKSSNIITNSGTLTISGGYNSKYLNAQLNNTGTIVDNHSVYYLYFQNGAILNNSGIYELQQGSINNSSNSSVGTFNNSGTFKKTTADTATIGVAFNNTGTVNVEAGTLTLSGGGVSNGGTFNLTSGQTLQIDNSVYTFSNGTKINGSGKLLVSGGTLQADENWTLPTISTWYGGTFKSSNIITNSGTLTIVGNYNSKYLNAQLNNTGTIVDNHSVYYLYFQNGAILNNSGIYELQQGSINNSSNSSVGTFNNSGTFKKTTADTATIGVAFNNTGTVNVEAGTLTLSGGGVSNGGTFNLTSGQTLQIDNSVYTFSNGTKINGSGKLLVSGGTLQADENWTLPTISTWYGGTFKSSNIITNSGTLTIVGNYNSKYLNAQLNNTGTIVDNHSVYYLYFQNGAILNNSGIYELQQGSINNSSNSSVGTFNNSGTFKKTTADTATIDVAFNNTGIVEANLGTLNFSNTYTQNNANLVLKGGNVSFSNALTINGGSIEGNGSINVGVTNSGLLNPRYASNTEFGRLTINSNYTETNSARINIQLGGSTAGTNFDQVDINGTATFDGTLNVSLLNSFTPTIGSTFDVLTYDSLSLLSNLDFTGLDINSTLQFLPQWFNDKLTLKVVDKSTITNINVTTNQDVVNASDGVLSLREAVIEANQNSLDNTIILGAQTYALNFSGNSDDNLAATGDLDILPRGGRLTIQGQGANQTFITATNLANLFQIHAGATINFSNVTIINSLLNDTVSVSKNVPLNLNVLNNDKSLKSQSIWLDDFQTTSVKGGTITRDNNGTPTDLSDDRLIYNPVAEFTGQDSFTYNITDGLVKEQATVTLNVANDAPPAINERLNTPINTAITFAILTNNRDYNGDIINFESFQNSSTFGGIITKLNNQLTYTPKADFSGPDTFSYKVNDGFLTTQSTVTVLVNAPPNAVITTTQDTINYTDGLLSLREAIIQANSANIDSKITLGEGTYALAINGANEDLAATGDLDIKLQGKTLTIQGQGKNKTILDANSLDRFFQIHSGATVILSGVTINKGLASYGGALANNGTLTILDSDFVNNQSIGAKGANGANGANGKNGQSVVAETFTFFRDATAGENGKNGEKGGDGKGGGIYNSGTLTISNSLIENNKVTGGQGGIGGNGGQGGVMKYNYYYRTWNEYKPNGINGSKGSNGNAYAGAIYNENTGSILINGGQFVNNLATPITGGTADNGDVNGIYNNGGTVTINSTVIESAGNTKLVKDTANKYFAQLGTNTPISIKTGRQQIYQDIYGSGWQTLAAETVNGDNQVLWKNVPGNYLTIWHLDNNWNVVSSEGNWGLNSPEAFTQETNFGIDANGDGKIGNPYTAIESAGNTKLVKDAANKYFAQVGTATPTAIKNGGQQLYQDIYIGWQTIAAETVNGDNQLLWKNIPGNYLTIWHLDNNWNGISYEGQWGLNSAEALTQETNFGIDTNGDGVIGNPYTPIESAGNTKLVKDANNKYFAQVGTVTPITIKAGGQQIYQDIYAGWQTLAAETVNGDNQVLWKNVSGNFLHIWHLDSNWNWVSAEGNWGLNSAEALTQETNFGIDTNGDGKIGYAIIESAGNTTFLKDAANKYFTQVGTATPIAIKAGGQQIYQDIYAGWQTLAAETVNGDNQVLWKNVSGNFLHIWHLDSNWNWVSSEGNWGLNSAEALTQETNFGIDANGDGKIGYAIIESAGNTTFLKDAANKYFTQVGIATPIAIKGGQQIYQDIYAGWQTLATETVNGDNQVLWKNVSGNFLHIWHLDSNWNWVSSEGNWGFNSAEALTQETNFGVDANGDGKIGYAIIESAGNTTFLKDAANKYFTQVGTATPIAIKAGGQQIYQDIYAGWQTLATETVNGDNQVLWKNVSGNFLHIWHLDSNWNWVSSEGNWGFNSAEALTQETVFGVDANGDGVIGNPYTPIESAGNTKLVKDSTNKYFAQVGTNNPIAIKAGGQQIYQDIYAGWQTLAAETVNGDNQVLWKNVSGKFLHIWHLDSNWNWVSSEGNWGFNSAEALTQETKFGIDANGDGKIGSPSSLTLTGTSGNDILIGGANSDTFNGGLANDTLLVRVGDGIAANTGFGTGQLLVTLSETSGFTSANANINLFGGNFLFN